MNKNLQLPPIYSNNLSNTQSTDSIDHNYLNINSTCLMYSTSKLNHHHPSLNGSNFRQFKIKPVSPTLPKINFPENSISNRNLIFDCNTVLTKSHFQDNDFDVDKKKIQIKNSHNLNNISKITPISTVDLININIADTKKNRRLGWWDGKEDNIENEKLKVTELLRMNNSSNCDDLSDNSINEPEDEKETSFSYGEGMTNENAVVVNFDNIVTECSNSETQAQPRDKSEIDEYSQLETKLKNNSTSETSEQITDENGIQCNIIKESNVEIKEFENTTILYNQVTNSEKNSSEKEEIIFAVAAPAAEKDFQGENLEIQVKPPTIPKHPNKNSYRRPNSIEQSSSHNSARIQDCDSKTSTLKFDQVEKEKVFEEELNSKFGENYYFFNKMDLFHNEKYSNFKSLFEYIVLEKFENALDLVNQVYNKFRLIVNKEEDKQKIKKMHLAFEDLKYIITKFWLMNTIQSEEKRYSCSESILENSIKPIVEQEILRNYKVVDEQSGEKVLGSRGEWFRRDYSMLKALLLSYTESLPISSDNIYSTLNLNSDMNNFWFTFLNFSISNYNKKNNHQTQQDSCPLYAIALESYFPLPINGLVDKVDQIKSQQEILPNNFGKVAEYQKKVVKEFKIENLNSDKNTEFGGTNNYRCEEKSVAYTSSRKSKSRTSKLDNQQQILNDDFQSISSSVFSPTAEVEKLMPPPSKIVETSDFAISTVCGPVLTHIRALDVIGIPETGEIIAATAGGEDRSDKKISIWNCREGKLLRQLDNLNFKPIIILNFIKNKKNDSNFLVSIDMEFDLKIFDWKNNEILKVFKKIHTRIIYQSLIFGGGGDDLGPNSRIATCSADQTIKIFDFKEDKPAFQSVHANEPFTSFVVCGGNSNDVSGQTLVASLSYCLRVYKMRTLSLMHVIQMKQLKHNKTPISCICSHPTYDNYILISCDNQLRLYDLSSETTLRTFSARTLTPGVRIEGKFSPCGTFVYSNSWDKRSFFYQKAQNNTQLQKNKKKNLHSNNANNNNENNFPEFSSKGVFIWKVQNSKLEKPEMKAMEEGCSRFSLKNQFSVSKSCIENNGLSDNDEDNIVNDGPEYGKILNLPVTCCKWILMENKSRFESAGVDNVR
ncbi:hypothetical protein HDU92_004615 [Lobulomyces angularis]|nr:hypothetical protein HDU92_004615 [Lobulomyces angularis]